MFRSLNTAAAVLAYARELRRTPICTCPVCDAQGRFTPAGSPPRLGVVCLGCGSYERHRLLALADRELGLFARRRILHFAPEPAIRSHIGAQSPASYVTADLSGVGVDRAEDVEATSFPDDAFDVVVISHVLEHVSDDARALRELTRITGPGGQIVIMIPVVDGRPETFEIGSASTAAERLRLCGQDDHLRVYGRDVRNRILATGLELREFVPTPHQIADHGLLLGETVFLATVPGSSD
ncbi:unannotated protein [freshwater metagenome]|uniref:Unannotated protein n=1 Tax=freshwater metagenome TaxID=449393 RepID=A0A6J7HXS8_9ZZZZ